MTTHKSSNLAILHEHLDRRHAMTVRLERMFPPFPAERNRYERLRACRWIKEQRIAALCQRAVELNN